MIAVDHNVGLNAAQVAERVRNGQTNAIGDGPSRSVGQIIRANVVNRFNLLMLSLLGIVIACGAYKDTLFGGVIVANAVVGVVQELRAKRALDRLAVLAAPSAWIVREGAVANHAVNEIVLDDVIELRPGEQVVADAVVLWADRLELDESFLTGESDPVTRTVGEEVMSGSFVVAGRARAQVHRVGADAYAVRLAEEAKRFTLATSELRAAMDRIILWIIWALIPTGSLLVWSQLRSEHLSVRDALVRTVGGVVAIVPEGLVLLMSVAFAVGVVRLARRRTLVQELPAVEMLARVDVLCLDKTGTITEGAMDVIAIEPLALEPLANDPMPDPHTALAALAWADPDANATQQALQAALPDRPDWRPVASVAFSSARKWSAQQFADRGTWVIGAPEVVASDDQLSVIGQQVSDHAGRGRRVILLAYSPDPLTGDELPAVTTPAALVLIEDRIRPDAADTLSYFAEQGVTLKVISGDNPTTVAAVAQRAGLVSTGDPVDARHLPDIEDEPAFAEAVLASNVFGRVNPHQKRAMVGALQRNGHVVAMTGDGVNDVLALKDADVGIAMASGSAASRSVAQLVLLDSNFSGLPAVVLEGRRVINNLQRVATMFLTKTTAALAIALVTAISGITYPYQPRQLTLISTLVIGIPSFFLALAPNTDLVRGNFFAHVASVSVPAGLCGAASAMVSFAVADSWFHGSPAAQSTAAICGLAAVMLSVLVHTARPFVPWKGALIAAVAVAVTAALETSVGRSYFDVATPEWWMVATGAAAAAFTWGLLRWVSPWLLERLSRVGD